MVVPLVFCVAFIDGKRCHKLKPRIQEYFQVRCIFFQACEVLWNKLDQHVLEELGLRSYTEEYIRRRELGENYM